MKISTFILKVTSFKVEEEIKIKKKKTNAISLKVR